ncbi:hypothetical protein HaLaN_06438 [Haematococcus lacustris]|uniref:Uncharacterized protein n=1 Tax=Haematococcus lacustris TaxID=44745 RepID=A0A699YNY3_HAELA|nr:hypothetical protein HaLaN_06438 [Haematococcus lacustris]
MEELTTALVKLGSIPARLLNSFPRLTALAIGSYSIPCSSLASLFSHPQLALQLQQLDLTGTTVLHANEAKVSEQFENPGQPGQPGAIALDHLFHGLRLKQLSLDVHETKLMPDLQPLAPHLTQLCIVLEWCQRQPRALALLVGALPQLQVLTLMKQAGLQDVLQLLPALPRLHTLQLPHASIYEQQQLDALLAATQLTSIQLESIFNLTSRRTDAACSWQRLELTKYMDCASACCLPLHSLTQPLLLGGLSFSVLATEDQVQPQELLSLLQPLGGLVGRVKVLQLCDLDLADAADLARLCEGCTDVEFCGGSLTPSLDSWEQLVHYTTAVPPVTFKNNAGACSVAMRQLLWRLSKQAWAQGLDITIKHTAADLPKEAAGTESALMRFTDFKKPAKKPADNTKKPQTRDELLEAVRAERAERSKGRQRAAAATTLQVYVRYSGGYKEDSATVKLFWQGPSALQGPLGPSGPGPAPLQAPGSA